MQNSYHKLLADRVLRYWSILAHEYCTHMMVSVQARSASYSWCIESSVHYILNCHELLTSISKTPTLYVAEFLISWTIQQPTVLTVKAEVLANLSTVILYFFKFRQLSNKSFGHKILLRTRQPWENIELWNIS